MSEGTKLVYLEHMILLELSARVIEVREEERRTIVVLDQTVFYPQGGGQPYDQGYIRSDTAAFKVEEVRFVDGIVKHIGAFDKGLFIAGDPVVCQVDPKRRALHARLHSGGHVMDLALQEMNLGWIPSKGYHFPQGPYVEYTGSIEDAGDIETFRGTLEKKANEIIQRNDAVSVRFMPKEEMHTVCRFVPEYLPAGKPARVVMYGDVGIPCGGTHVAQLADIGHLTIRKVKKEKDAVRVSYEVS